MLRSFVLVFCTLASCSPKKVGTDLSDGPPLVPGEFQYVYSSVKSSSPVFTIRRRVVTIFINRQEPEKFELLSTSGDYPGQRTLMLDRRWQGANRYLVLTPTDRPDQFHLKAEPEDIFVVETKIGPGLQND